MTCKQCGRPLTADEIALHKRLVNRSAAAHLCLTCLAGYFGCSEDVLREKIALTPLHLRCAKLRRSPYRRNCPVGRYSMGRILTLAGMKSLSVWTRIWWRNTGAKF